MFGYVVHVLIRIIRKIDFYFERRRQLKRYEKIKNHIPDDEFDQSLDMDIEIMAVMTSAELREYERNLIRRRNAAHEKGLLHD